MSTDNDTKRAAFKILIVISIIATILFNLMLLIRCIRVPGFLNIPCICMRMTVAAGSIFMALFSYVVLAKIIFGDTEDMSCRTYVTSTIYMQAFLTFVFGCSVALQCCNLYFSNRFPCKLNPKIQSIAIAGIPWILGILIVCPLSMSGIDWERNCRGHFTLSRIRAILVISVLLPACIALIFSIILSCKPTTHNPVNVYQDQAEAVTMPLNPPVTTSYPTQPYGIDSPPEYKKNQNTKQNPEQYPQQYPQQQPQANPQQHPPQYHQLYPKQDLQGSPQPYPQQYPMQNPNSQASGLVVPISSQLQQANTSTVVSPTNNSLKKSGFLLASLIFFVSVMPYACFNLGYILNPDRSPDLSRDSFDIISDVCSWFLHIYPILVPLVWFRQIV